MKKKIPTKARVAKVTKKKLKRKKTVARRAKHIKRMIGSGRMIVFGNGNRAIRRKKAPVKKASKPKVEKELKPYRAVKLTRQLDRINQAIKMVASTSPLLPKMKARRDLLKKKLNLVK